MSHAAMPTPRPPGRATEGAETGPTPSFRAVYAEHAQTVARWAARLGGPAADVDEITQEVFMVVNRRLAEFHGPGRMSTWLFGITAKVAANERRRRKVRNWWLRLAPGTSVDEPDRVGADPLPGDGPLEQLEKRERR